MVVGIYNVSALYEYVYNIYGMCVVSMKECIDMGVWSMVVCVKLYMMWCVLYPSKGKNDLEYKITAYIIIFT